ncbi:hypothetical protein C3Y98_04405 [Methylotenera oryzisoli]|uniref:TniQ domain-containing protein n=1 Tax=Methylotenera oryzisoli TaxID=2080758 RepID=A0A4Y9VT05_9PROT|nr:TniQ family protein [Methylotenera oryzisoli]TFW72353.1 hypothetical protein C3Y98_04405 [Methylotenera oryzisoli]
MDNKPSLLIHPHPYRTEGPQGYLLRLASENFMLISDLASMGIVYDFNVLKQNGFLPSQTLDPGLHEYVKTVAELSSYKKNIFNHKFARFCPICLAEDPYWRVGWEMYFYDACHEHEVWLIDHCSSCGKPLSWQRERVVRCQCGADLRMEIPAHSTKSVAYLARVMLAKLNNMSIESLPAPLEKTNLDQTQQLVRFLGACLRPGAGNKPLKIKEAGAMSSSWSISSFASEILTNWPQKFFETLNQMQKEAFSSVGTSLKNIFGSRIDYIYKEMAADAFSPLRNEFSFWHVTSYYGGIAKRNLRLIEAGFKNAEWIPANLACKELGISRGRLKRFVRDGLIEGHEKISEAGRSFITVMGAQLESTKAKIAGSVTIEEAGKMLGISRKRMRAILRFLFPNATRDNHSPLTPWRVPRSDIESVLNLSDGLPIVCIPDEDCVTLNFLLRYWPWETMEIVGLIEASKRQEIKPVAVLDGSVGVSGLIYNENELKTWREKSQQGYGTWISIPQLCKMLSIKQTVGYKLVKNGFIETERLPTVRGGGHRLKKSQFFEFNKKYIFATEVNAKLGTVTTKLRTILAERSIHPVSGPGVDDSRQVLYERTDKLMKFMDEYSGKPPTEFRLT